MRLKIELRCILFPLLILEIFLQLDLRKCFASVISTEEANTRETAYFMEAGVLMRKWAAHDCVSDWSEVCQVVVPTPF
jgi:hypothetical protein